MPYNLSNLEIVEVSLVKRGANNKRFIARKDENPYEGKLFWMNDNLEIVNKEVDIMPEKTKEELEAERIAKEQAEVLRIEKEKADADRIAKEQAEKLEKEQLAKENLELKERLEKAEKIAKEALEKAETEKEARLIKEFSTMAKEQLAFIGSDMEVGLLLKEASVKLAKESYDKLFTLLKAANEKIKESPIFREVGKSGEGTEIKGFDKIDKLAKELVAKDSSLSYPKALDIVIRQNPELYNEYTNSR